MPGTDAASLANPADDHQVEGYASVMSAAAGETVELRINVDREENVRWELYRHGYYQGLGARAVASGDPVDVQVQPECPVDKTTGLIECDWASAFSVTIDPGWVTGYYTFKLINDDGYEAEIPLIVRESGRHAPLLMQATANTWQAYNAWGGTSLYVNHLPAEAGFSGAKASRVSFDRPYAYQNSIEVWLPMVEWLESKGYDMAYITNIDVDADPSVMLDRKLFLSASHDEYVSQSERDATVAARDQGVSLAFASANDIYKHVEFTSSKSGTPRRVMVVHSRYNTGHQRQPESDILGTSWDNWSGDPRVPLIVTNADHWVYEGTGVRNFDALANVIGPEWNTVNGRDPQLAGLEIVTASPTVTDSGMGGQAANATFYYPTPSSFVFSAGTIGWGFALSSDPSEADARVQRMTENILRRAGLVPLDPTIVAPREQPAARNPLRFEVLAGSGERGTTDGPALSATFDSPAGIAAGTNGELYVVDAIGFLRKLSPDGQVSTIAGCSATSSGRNCFGVPTGIAIGSDGTIYVSDTDYNVIYSVLSDGTVSIYAGTRSAGFADATDRTRASFSGPRGLAIGSRGEIYVADTHNDAIRRIDSSGVTTFATGLTEVSAVAVDDQANVYFSSIVGGQVGKVELGAVLVLACPSAVPGNREGPGMAAHLRPMDGLLVESNRLLFSDTGNDRLRTLALGGARRVSTLVGDASVASDLASGLHLSLPRGIAPYQGGYAISDAGHHRIVWIEESGN